MGLLKLHKVLISDKIAEVCVKTLEAQGVQVSYKPGLSASDLLDVIPEYHGLVVRSATKVTAEVIKAATNLEIIGRAGTGTDNIDIAAASERGVVVMNTPGGNTASAAEHTCALLLAMCRNLPNRHTELMNGAWNRINGIELNGKTIGIVGLGRIGMIVAHRMQAFGMITVGYDPFVTAEAAAEKNVKKMELEEMWPECDFLTLHVPLIPATKHMVDARVLARCKKGVRIVNCARGGIIDEAALLDALNSGQAACAALDVFEQEPPRADSPLLQHPNLIASPHLGASTVEAQTRVAKEIAEQFVALRDGKSTFGCINAPLLSAALQCPSQCRLAQYLGMVLHMLAPDTALIRVHAPSDKFLPKAVLAGFLSAAGVPGSNLISIDKVAAERKLEFEYKQSAGELAVSAGEVTVSGKTEGDMCFITRINDANTLVPLSGNMSIMKEDGKDKLDSLKLMKDSMSSVYFAGQYIITSSQNNNGNNTLTFA